MPPDISKAGRDRREAVAVALLNHHRRAMRMLLLALFALQIVGMLLAARNWVNADSAHTVDARNWLGEDSYHYLEVATNFRATHTFSAYLGGRLQPEAWRPLGYPAFLALLEAIAGPHPLAIVIVQEGLVFFAVVLVGRCCARFRPGGETVFLCLVLLYPAVAWVGATVMTEAPCMFLVVLSALCLLSPRRWRGAVAAGFLLGLTAWFRANLLLLGTAAGLGMAVFGKDRSWKRGLIVAAVSLAVMVPNSARNYRLFGSVSPLTYVSEIGPPLYWNSLHSRGDFSRDVNNNTTAQAKAILAATHGSDLDDLAQFPTVADQYTANRMLVRAALANIRAHPTPYFAAVAANLFALWIPDHSLHRFPPVHALLSAVDAAIVLLGLWGMFLAVRHPDRFKIPGSLAAAAAAMCVYLSVSMCWFYRDNRYTTPGALLMLAFAAVAGAHLMSAFSGPGSKKQTEGLASAGSRDVSCQRVVAPLD